ncbi:MAG: hypothetical protein JWP17_336 [Solirubrobacterales bacterium]|jgi:hypothetical protein|nr:hypothetical protein [Solirubrobacterales bacterium]
MLVRWALPAALLVAGVVILGWYDIEGVGEALVAASVCVLIANLMFRFSFSDVNDRDRDEQARAFFDEHGHWPGES